MSREMEMKQLNSQLKEGRKQLKSLSCTKANKLNRYILSMLEEIDYDCALIHEIITDILRSKDVSPLQDLWEK